MFDVINKKQLALKLIFYDTFHDLLILKQTPKKVTNILNRLDRKLGNISGDYLYSAVTKETLDYVLYHDQFIKAYSEAFKGVFKVGTDEIIQNPIVSLTKSPISPEKWDKLISENSFKASDTTMSRLTGDVLPKIQEGIANGQSLDKTANALKSEFKDMSKGQLQRISRTETHRMYNQSKLETMKAAKIPGKKWVASGLSNMRDAHAEADGQTVATEDPFIVDGEELDYPGDEAGSAENVINCACTMVPDTRYGRDGNND